MSLGRVLLAMFLLAMAASAQVTIISVDTALTRNNGKSLLAPMAMSALLPGTGERYLGEADRSKPFLAVDGVLWAAVLVAWWSGESQMSSMREYAARYSGFRPPADDDVLDIVGKYRSRSGSAGLNGSPDNNEDYDQAMIRGGLVPSEQLSDKYSWDWGASDNPETQQRMDSYNAMLRRWRMTRIAFQITAGALLLNRVVSMVDVLRIHRATAVGSLAVDADPVLAPGIAGASMRISF